MPELVCHRVQGNIIGEHQRSAGVTQLVKRPVAESSLLGISGNTSAKVTWIQWKPTRRRENETLLVVPRISMEPCLFLLVQVMALEQVSVLFPS